MALESNEVKELKNDRRFKLFRRFVSIPYLLALVGLLMPFMNVSCSDSVIAEPSFYEMASGLNLHETLKEPARGTLEKMEKGNPKAIEKFQSSFPGFPELEPVYHLFGIAGALVLAAVFAWFAPLASLAMGMLSMFSLWAILSQMGRLCANSGLPLLTVEPGVGIYAASTLIVIGTAMNLASMIRPIVVDIRARKRTKSVQ